MQQPARVTRRERDKEKYRERYRQAIHMALRWMDRHKATQQFLADHLGVNRTTLSKFLSESPGFHPYSGRPVMVNILERIEACCTDVDLDLVDEEYLPPADAEQPDDDYEWFRHHTVRLRQLPRLEPVMAMGRVSELCSQATHGPNGYRAAMALNTVMRLAFVLEREEAACATPRLLRQTAARVRQLEQAALESMDDIVRDEVRAAVPHRATGYSGYALAYTGMYLGDADLVAEGLDRLFAAVTMTHSLTAGHWSNLFRVIETLLEKGHPGARAAAERAAELAWKSWDENVQYTLTNRSYDRLCECWETSAPDLVRRIGEKVS